MTQLYTILCPVDFSELSDHHLEMAVDLCAQLDARLVLHHNETECPPGALGVQWMWSEEHRAETETRPAEVENRMQRLLDRVPADVPCEARLSRGPLEEGLLYLAEELPADLIVMGSHAEHDRDHRSLTDQVVAKAPCPVLTRSEKLGPRSLFEDSPAGDAASRFLVAVDVEQPDERALEIAWWIAGRTGHRPQLMHVIPAAPASGSLSAVAGGSDRTERASSPARAEVESSLRRLVPDSMRSRVDVHVRQGDPAGEILRLGRNLDARFIVLGGRRGSGIRDRLRHPPSLEVLHRADRPVWCAPAQRQARSGL